MPSPSVSSSISTRLQSGVEVEVALPAEHTAAAGPGALGRADVDRFPPHKNVPAV